MKKEKLHDQAACGKSTLQNSVSILKKNYQKSRNKGQLLQSDEEHIKNFIINGERLNAFALKNKNNARIFAFTNFI